MTGFASAEAPRPTTESLFGFASNIRPRHCGVMRASCSPCSINHSLLKCVTFHKLNRSHLKRMMINLQTNTFASRYTSVCVCTFQAQWLEQGLVVQFPLGLMYEPSAWQIGYMNILTLLFIFLQKNILIISLFG